MLTNEFHQMAQVQSQSAQPQFALFPPNGGELLQYQHPQSVQSASPAMDPARAAIYAEMKEMERVEKEKRKFDRDAKKAEREQKRYELAAATLAGNPPPPAPGRPMKLQVLTARTSLANSAASTPMHSTSLAHSTSSYSMTITLDRHND